MQPCRKLTVEISMGVKSWIWMLLILQAKIIVNGLARVSHANGAILP
jgi:hypothetical protein